MRVSPGQYSFTGGELSPLFASRADLERYAAAGREMVNAIPLPEGPLTRRPGTRFVAPVRGDAAGILIPFEFSVEQAYVVEVTAGAFRFYMNGARLEAGGVPYEVASPYGAADLDRLRWTQSADVLFLACPGHAPRMLSRTGHTAWTLTLFEPEDGPYLDVDLSDTSLTPSAAGGAVTITASAPVFAATDVGRLLRIGHDGAWGWCRITAVASGTEAAAAVKGDFAAAAATVTWRLGAWSDTTGWPECVTIHQGRLVWGATRTAPDTVWLSTAAGYTDYAPTMTDGVVAGDNAITLTSADDRVNAVRWLASAHGRLIAGTSGGPFAIEPAGDGPLMPSNAAMRRGHVAGAAAVPPARVGGSLAYASRTRGRLWQLAYDWTAEGYSAPALSLAAAHLAGRGIRAMAYQHEPWSVLWLVLDDGMLAGVTHVPELQILAWHRHAIGGTDARVLSLAVVPGPDRDELWLLVERTVDGAVRRHVEVMEAPFAPSAPDDQAGAAFVDAHLTYDGPPVEELAGLDHLEGETVQVLADGALHPPRLVQGGAIALQGAASRVVAGLACPFRFLGLDLQLTLADGSTLGRPRRIDQVTIHRLDSLGGRVGIDGAPLETLPIRQDSDPIGEAPRWQSGTSAVRVGAGWARAVAVVVENADPLPMTITAIVPRLSVT